MSMRFRKHHPEEPEINLIPFIDVLLVVLIFLMLSTTYAKFTELQITLPVADADRPRDNPREVIIAVSSDGRYAIDGRPIQGRTVEALAGELTSASGGSKDTTVIVSADAASSHQSVVAVMDAARRAGLPKLTFAAQGSQSH